jgi:hypothetical protein
LLASGWVGCRRHSTAARSWTRPSSTSGAAAGAVGDWEENGGATAGAGGGNVTSTIVTTTTLGDDGYLGKILNAKVYDVAIETELQYAENLSRVSECGGVVRVLLPVGWDGMDGWMDKRVLHVQRAIGAAREGGMGGGVCLS